MEKELDFKIGDIVYQKAPLGTYNEPMKIVSIQTNLARCEWIYEGKKYYREVLFKSLIHERNHIRHDDE